MKKVDREQMALGYVEMARINQAISEEFNQTELKRYLEMEEGMNGEGTGTNVTPN